MYELFTRRLAEVNVAFLLYSFEEADRLRLDILSSVNRSTYQTNMQETV